MQAVLRFWQELAAVHATKPEWRLSNRVLYQNCSFVLRSFREGEGAPVLIVPPNAGHHSSIAQKLIEAIMEVAPKASIYSMDWLPASACNDSRSDTIASLNNYVSLSVDIIGQPVHLIGLCQGGWLAAIYTALHQDRVKSLILAASPIDFHAAKDDSKIYRWVENLPMSWFEWMVNAGGGVQPGEFQLAGFKILNPYDRYVGDYMELWDAVAKEDEKAITRWKRNHIWYDNPQSLGGAWYLEAVDTLFKKNLLVKKQLTIEGRVVDLARITCPVYMIAGAEDDITHQDELFAIEQHISSATVEKIVIPECGHIGVFVRDNALRYWRRIIQEAYQNAADKLADELKL